MPEKLFTPITLGNVTIKNRVLFPSMCVYYADKEGFIDEVLLAYVEERVKGGVGMFIMPGSPHGKAGPGRPALSDDKYIPGWKKMADMVHANGGKLFCQIHPAAMQAGRGHEVRMPSDYTAGEIDALIKSYAACAVRCKEAGVDGVEIHGAHAHEAAQFMSPFYNDRTDEYGGSVENRSRFSMEVIKGIKVACGKEYPLIFRLSGTEEVAGGRAIEESAEVAKFLELAGADAIHVSCGMPESEGYISAPMDVPDLFNVNNAAVVKKAVSIPVIAVDRVVDVAQAVDIVEKGQANMVAMGRAHLSDPEIVNKYLGLNDEPVRRCVGCNQGCRDAILYRRICCMQNPRLGNETTLNYTPVSGERKNEKIMVVGAGPAGLEAALDLAIRGFKPAVYEGGGEPGGLAALASSTPNKQNIFDLVGYRVKMLGRMGIEIKYNTTVDAALVAAEKPDILIIATGSVPFVPNIPGRDGAGVFTGDAVIKGAAVAGKKVLVLGGGLIGCEVAEYLAGQGKSVEIVEMADDVAKDLTLGRRRFMLERMSGLGIQIRVGTKVLSVALPEVKVSVKGYEQTLAGYDAVVIAAGRRSFNQLEADVKAGCPGVNVHVIGDAAKAGFALDAIKEAARLAASL